MFRFFVFVSAVALVGCNGCPGSLANTQVEPVRFSTEPLRFPDTAVGAETELQLELTNPSRVSQTVVVSVDAPFFVPESYAIPPGSSEALSITFRPTQPGEASATLRIDEGEVAVSGLALAPPMCSGAVCRAGRFDATSMQCVLDVVADGTGCSDGCVEQGQCQNGACVGAANSCDDADQCTVDACGDEGCIHLPRECAAGTDPCRVPACDSQTGCTTRDADDGTVCGSESCIAAEVRVCISGQCVARPRPETAQCSRTWVPLIIPATWDSKLAWDSVNEQIIALIGGQTWSWKGTRWEQLFPPAAPPNDKYELAVDSWRKRVVVFMGSTTWEWDGSTWLHRGDEPEPRLAPAMAYDAKRRVTVRFGGSGLNGHGNDTWVWDGMKWERKTPAHTPSGRAFASMQWDPVREKIVLYGGADTSFNKLSDTWEWDGNDWRLVPINSPPPARMGASLTWDPTRLSLVLVGGQFVAPVPDVWSFNGTAWVQLATNEIAASGHGAEWDPVRGNLIVFSLGGTWEWSGTRFISRRAIGPNPRMNAGMTFDDVHMQTVSYGGIAVPFVAFESLDELWLRDVNGWSARGVMPRPAPRYSPMLEYDAVHQRVVMFGGSSVFGTSMGPIGQPFDDTWEWDGVSWHQRTPMNSPSAGAVTSSTWDSASQRVVVLTNSDGTWFWDGSNWSRLAESSTLVNYASSIAFERTQLKLIGVTENRTYALETDGGWAPIATASLPSNINNAKLACDRAGNRLMLHAFRGTFAWNGTTWVDLMPRVLPLSETEKLLFDANLNRVTAYTTNDEWVYLP